MTQSKYIEPLGYFQWSQWDTCYSFSRSFFKQILCGEGLKDKSKFETKPQMSQNHQKQEVEKNLTLGQERTGENKTKRQHQLNIQWRINICLCKHSVHSASAVQLQKHHVDLSGFRMLFQWFTFKYSDVCVGVYMHLYYLIHFWVRPRLTWLIYRALYKKRNRYLVFLISRLIASDLPNSCVYPP